MPAVVYDVAVVGCGMIGSAAVKYLTQSGRRVAAIAATSPLDPTSNAAGCTQEVFSSHDDAARVQRVLDPRPHWLSMNLASVARYKELEHKSGIKFHYPVRCVYATTYENDALLCDSANLAKKHGISISPLYHHNITLPTSRGFVEHAPAGYISPLHLISAQLASTSATITQSIATSVTRKSNLFSINLRNGDVIHAYQILVTAGAFCNANFLLPQPLQLTLKGEIVLQAQVSLSDAHRLHDMPSGLLEIDTSDYEGVYWTPPAPYSLNKRTHYCIKLGCNLPADPYFTSLSEVQSWFRDGNSNQHFDVLRDLFYSLFPDVQVVNMWTKRCVLTRTPTGNQYIGRVDDEVYVATGGNGYSAMCSDELGRIAAYTLTHDGNLPVEYDKKLFTPLIA